MHFNQQRYVRDLLKKYDKIGSSVTTPMVPPNMLGPDLNGKVVNETQYRGMIGSLMNLTASRPDIQFSTCLYARHQANIRNPTLLLLREYSGKEPQCYCNLKQSSSALKKQSILISDITLSEIIFSKGKLNSVHSHSTSTC
ncbi:hypothetical protein Tco_0689172 [Tanacetum coccineum]